MLVIEGGAPLAGEDFASSSAAVLNLLVHGWFALGRIQESRVSDTRAGPEPRVGSGRADTFLSTSFGFGVCSLKIE